MPQPLDYAPRPRRRLRPLVLLVIVAVMFAPLTLVRIREMYFVHGPVGSGFDVRLRVLSLLIVVAGTMGIVVWAVLTAPKGADGKGEK